MQKIAGRGHDSLVIDAQTDGLMIEETRQRVEQYDPDFLVIPSAPSYLFWRCPPPELRVPREWFDGIAGAPSGQRGLRAARVLVGPHGSATPPAPLRQSGAAAVSRGQAVAVPHALEPRAGQPVVAQRRGAVAEIEGHVAQVVGAARDRQLVPQPFRQLQRATEPALGVGQVAQRERPGRRHVLGPHLAVHVALRPVAIARLQRGRAARRRIRSDRTRADRIPAQQ